MNDKRFCVYFHRRKDTGELFYIGQGTLDRSKSKARKMKLWHDTVEEANGFFVEIYKKDLTKAEALRLETELIEQYSDSIINKITSSSTTKQLDFEEFNWKFYIDESSPSGLRYKVDVYAGSNYTSKVHSQGDVAGVLVKADNSWSLSHNRQAIRVHRIVYLLKHGALDSSKVIDHIDGNPSNNAVTNLREVDHKVNRRNLAKDKRNSTGVSGVSYAPSTGTYKCYISTDTERLAKSFSISKYGKDEALRLAIEWRIQKLQELNQQGAGYTDRHGT
jgi:hypothetical protein